MPRQCPIPIRGNRTQANHTEQKVKIKCKLGQSQRRVSSVKAHKITITSSWRITVWTRQCINYRPRRVSAYNENIIEKEHKLRPLTAKIQVSELQMQLNPSYILAFVPLREKRSGVSVQKRSREA